MNIREAIAFLWELSGEQSDLDVWGDGTTDYDPAVDLNTSSFGVRYYIRELNKAQNTLANWRTSKGRPIRFNKFQTRKNVKLGLDSQDAGEIDFRDDYTIRVTNPPSMTIEDYVDTKLSIIYTERIYDDELAAWVDSGQTTSQDLLAVLVEPVDATTLEFTFQEEIEASAYDTYTSSVEFYFNAFRLRRSAVSGNGYTINLPTYTRNISAITSMNNGSQLSRASAKTRLYDYNMTEGTPIQWYKNGEIIYFDSYLAEPTWFIFDYQRLPYEITSVDDDFDIPEQWLDVIYMLVEMSTAKRSQETERASILRSQINSLINQLRTDQEEEWLMEDTAGFVIQKEAK